MPGVSHVLTANTHPKVVIAEKITRAALPPLLVIVQPSAEERANTYLITPLGDLLRSQTLLVFEHMHFGEVDRRVVFVAVIGSLLAKPDLAPSTPLLVKALMVLSHAKHTSVWSNSHIHFNSRFPVLSKCQVVSERYQCIMETCGICLDVVNERPNVIPCGHNDFHLECLVLWR
jgi:hypothetical protein